MVWNLIITWAHVFQLKLNNKPASCLKKLSRLISQLYPNFLNNCIPMLEMPKHNRFPQNYHKLYLEMFVIYDLYIIQLSVLCNIWHVNNPKLRGTKHTFEVHVCGQWALCQSEREHKNKLRRLTLTMTLYKWTATSTRSVGDCNFRHVISC